MRRRLTFDTLAALKGASITRQLPCWGELRMPLVFIPGISLMSQIQTHREEVSQIETSCTTLAASGGERRQTPSLRMTKSAAEKRSDSANAKTARSMTGR